LAALALGFGVHEVGQALSFGQIELAVLEGAAGVFARLGWADAGLAQGRVDNRRDDGRAAMDVEFDDVFAGEAVGPGKPERQAIIERNAGARIAKRLARRHAWLGQIAGRQRAERRASVRPAEPDHSDASAASAGRKRCDSVRFHVKTAKLRLGLFT
jgi:hypothetical protein